MHEAYADAGTEPGEGAGISQSRVTDRARARASMPDLGVKGNARAVTWTHAAMARRNRRRRDEDVRT